jgi:hypothetical protein
MSMEDTFYAQLSLFSLDHLYVGLTNGDSLSQHKPGPGQHSPSKEEGESKDTASSVASAAPMTVHYFSVRALSV